ncbi:hypothetical protein [Massilia glaciei]|nr:hypothetical protein [Massilia glaciei]
MIKAALFLIFCFASMQAAAFAVPENASEGIEFQRSLLAAIERADRIIVREHSDPMDFDDGGETLPAAPEKTYVRKELSGFQKLRFASLVRAMSPVTQDAFPACIPEYHHTIGFIDKARRTRTVKICFRCGQLEFEGARTSPPASIYTTLSIFVHEIGMVPKRDWEKLARTTAAAHARSR